MGIVFHDSCLSGARGMHRVGGSTIRAFFGSRGFKLASRHFSALSGDFSVIFLIFLIFLYFHGFYDFFNIFLENRNFAKVGRTLVQLTRLSSG